MKARLELCSPEKSGEERSFGLVCYLDGVARTREGGIIGGGDMGIGGRATVGVVLCCYAVQTFRPIK